MASGSKVGKGKKAGTGKASAAKKRNPKKGLNKLVTGKTSDVPF